MSGQTPDVQLCAMDAVFCIIGHLVPNWGECSDVFLVVMTQIFSDILQMSNSAQWPRCFLHYRTTRAQLSRVFRCFPFLLQFKYFSDILRTSDSAQWLRHFCIIGQLAPNSAECSDVFIS